MSMDVKVEHVDVANLNIPPFTDDSNSLGDLALPPAAKESAFSYAASEGSGVMDKRSRGIISLRNLQRQTAQQVTELVKLSRQMRAALEARDRDSKANLQIAHEETIGDLRIVKDGLVHVAKATNAIPHHFQEVDASFRGAMTGLEQRMRDLVKENTVAIMDEMHLTAGLFESAQQNNSLTVEVFAERLNRAQLTAKDLQRENECLSKELKEARAALSEQHHNQSRLRTEDAQAIARLRQDLQQKSADLAKAHEALSAAQVAGQPGQLGRGQKVCDEALVEIWDALAYKIRSLAYVLSKKKRTEYIHPYMKPVQKQAESYKDIMKDEGCDSDILQTLLWRVVIHDVLFGWSQHWDDHPQRLLQVLKRGALKLLPENEDAAKKLGGWISDGTYHLAPMNDTAGDAKLPEKLSIQASQELLPMFDAPPGTLVGSQIQPGVQGIFALALELSKLMLCSRAFFTIHWIKPKLEAGGRVPFSPSIMECLASEREPRFLLWCLTPIFRKHGNADGQHYDQMSVLAKARVICQ